MVFVHTAWWKVGRQGLLHLLKRKTEVLCPGPSGRAVNGLGLLLLLLACSNCGFESHRGHGCLSVVSVVCCQVEVCASG